MSDIKIPKTLSTKHTKLASFINFYNKKLIDLGLDKEKVDSVFKIFDNDISTIISLQNEYFDYESSYIQEYKKHYKQNIQNEKNNDKQNKKYIKDLDKWNTSFYKIFHKALLNDPAFRHHILDIFPFHILDTLIPPSDKLPLPRLQTLSLPLSIQLATHSLNNPNFKPQEFLPNLKNIPNNPAILSTNSKKLETSSVDEKEDISSVDNNDLKDVTILDLNDNKYLCDNKNNVYDFKTHNKIGSINSNEDGILTTPISIDFI